MRALVPALLLISTLCAPLHAQQRLERSDLSAGDLSRATSTMGIVPSSAAVIQQALRGLTPHGTPPWDGVCRNFSGYTLVSASRDYCDFKQNTLTTVQCECGTRAYYQHYTLYMPSKSAGGYEEAVYYNCIPCPPPEIIVYPEYGGGGGN